MAPSFASAESGDDDERPELKSAKQSKATKRPRSNSGPYEYSTDRRKRHKSRPKKKKKKAAELSSDGETTPTNTVTRSSTQGSDRSDESDLNDDETPPTAKHANRTATAMERRMQNNPEVELAECIDRIKNSKSDAYKMFDMPKLKKPGPSGDYTHYTFKCKNCKELVKRKIGSSETSGTLGHRARCELKRKQQMLTQYGIVGSSSPPSGDQVREYCALWVCESGRPHRMLHDRYFRRLLPRELGKHLPHRTTITTDIKTMYQMTQNHIKNLLADIPGTFHIALDMSQTPNGFDFLGMVLFHPEVGPERSIRVKRFVLECLNFDTSHTGKALAKKTHAILCKFSLQDRVWGVVCDNASNNGAMMKQFKKFGLARLCGPECRVHCMLHILHLSAEAILLPFVKKQASVKGTGVFGRDENQDAENTEDGDDEDDEDEDGDDDDELVELDLFDEDDYDVEDDGTAPSRMLDPDLEESESESDEDLDSLVPNMVPGSEDAEELRKVICALLKLSWFANKLRRSARTKSGFKAICIEKEVLTPHNLRRDVKTRWDSTAQLLQDGERLYPAIVKYQSSSQFPRHRRITKEERKGIRVLLALLQPLETLTKILSRAGVPMLGSVIGHYDSLNHEYTRMCRDSTLPLWARQAADRARRKLNKYYQVTDESNLYRMAILLHPSFRVHYLTRAKWPQEWIDAATELTIECWETFYKSTEAPADAGDNMSEFSYSSFMDEICAELDDMGGRKKETDPVTRFVNGEGIFDRSDSGKSIPVNPLAWWHAQRLAGEEHDGLTQMAIDVLSTPATSVDVERAFSFVSATVSKRRHKLGPLTIQASASLGAYSRANLVKLGCLARARKLKAKQKAAEAKKEAARKAEEINVDQSESEPSEGEDKDESVVESRSSGSRVVSTSSKK